MGSNIPKGQNDSSDRGKESHNPNTLRNTAPGISNGPPPPPEHNSTKNHSGQPPWWRDRHFLLQIALFLIGAYVAFIYSCQLAQMVEQNRISRQSLESVQRAFISVNPVPEIQTANTGSNQLMLFNFWMENSGATPTKKLSAHINWVKSNQGLPLPPNFPFPDAGDDSRDSTVSVIGPKDKFPLSAGPISRDFIERLYKGEVRLFIYGWVAYNDEFKDTPRHTIKFSYEIVAVRGVVRLQNGQEGQGLQTFVNGPRHNCYDEECDEQAHQ